MGSFDKDHVQGSSRLPSGKRKILSDVSLKVRAGEAVAVVGPSGCGKSTLVQLLPRLYEVQSGSIVMDGVDIRDLDAEVLRGNVGLATQEPHLFNDTLRYNLTLGSTDLPDAVIMSALALVGAKALVEGLPRGLESVVGDRGCSFSGGERQRLALARLIVRRPSVVILDEATAHLDVESEAMVLRNMRNYFGDAIMIVITHRLMPIQSGYRIVTLVDGVVQEVGSHEELLLSGGWYSRLAALQ